MKYFVINLEKAIERRQKYEKEFIDNDSEFHRVDAFLYNPKDYHNLKNCKEHACHKSHIKAIFEFVMNCRDDYAIICEDDITFDFKKYWRFDINDIMKIAPKDTGIIQLAVIYTKIDLNPDWEAKNDFFVWGSIPSVGSCMAYLITRKCAVELLKYYLNLDSKKFKQIGPSDGRFGLYYNVTNFTHFKTYTYKYPMFVYQKENDTQLDNEQNNQIASRRHVEHYLKVKLKELENSKNEN
mgnify:CR=1 FL=1|tara:strand:- start:2025 stop:2741 length:717 start_codon:yes stop_codon:yes gene_type:complete